MEKLYAAFIPDNVINQQTWKSLIFVHALKHILFLQLLRF